jgi:hypothetical protein
MLGWAKQARDFPEHFLLGYRPMRLSFRDKAGSLVPSSLFRK